MVILISGPSCAGKTFLAQTLMEKYHVNYYSIDHIKMGLIKGFAPCELKATDSDEALTLILWPIVKGIIMTAIENHQNIIIEGVYMTPHNILDFEPAYAKEIMPIFLCFSESYIRANFQSKIINYRNVIEKRFYEEDRDISVFINNHHKLMNDCEKEHMTYFLVTDSFEHTMERILSHLDKTMTQYRMGGSHET